MRVAHCGQGLPWALLPAMLSIARRKGTDVQSVTSETARVPRQTQVALHWQQHSGSVVAAAEWLCIGTAAAEWRVGAGSCTQQTQHTHLVDLCSPHDAPSHKKMHQLTRSCHALCPSRLSGCLGAKKTRRIRSGPMFNLQHHHTTLTTLERC